MCRRRFVLGLTALLLGIPGSDARAGALGPQTPGLSTVVHRRSETLYQYPSPGLAVGPTQVLTIFNDRIRTVARATGLPDGVIDLPTGQFFGSVMTPIGGGLTSSFTLDPQARYDRLTNRWFVGVLNMTVTGSGWGPGRVLIAVSDAASAGTITAATTWRFEWIASNPSDFFDGLAVGLDASALYFGVRRFGTATGTYVGQSLIVVRKSSLVGAGPLVATTFPNAQNPAALPDFLQPVDNPDPGSTEGYAVGLHGVNQLQLRRVLDPGGTPGLSAAMLVDVPIVGLPLHVAHLGNTLGASGELFGGTRRLYGASLRQGRLWTVATSAVTATGGGSDVDGTRRNGVSWYELGGVRSADAPTPTLLQSGVIHDAAPTRAAARQYWMPSLAVSGQGHVAVGFSAAGAPYRVDVGVTGRLAGDSPGGMRPPVLLTNSTSAYNPPLGGAAQRQWGLGSATALDPLDDMTMWTVQQHCDTTNSWACRLVRLDAPPPASPSFVGTAEAGLANTTVSVQAQAPAGEGYFDPGPDLPAPALPFRHLSVQVANDGVTGAPPVVTGVTVISPTQLDVHLDTRLADPSVGSEKYTLIVRNPDGQQVVTSNALRVVPRVSGVTAGASQGAGLRAVSPNPARSGARIAFALTDPGMADVQVMDAQGRAVAVVAAGRFTAGLHTLAWDGRDGTSSAVTPGLYFVRLRAGGFTDVCRIAVVR